MKKNYIISALLLLFALFTHAQEQDYPLDTIQGEVVYTYQVEKGIGLYRIGLNFKVNQEDIIRLNPQLQKRGVHFGETLFIPAKKHLEAIKRAALPSQDSVALAAIIPPVSASLPAQKDSIETEILPNDSSILLVNDSTDRRRKIELAIMLPFESKQTKKSAQAERMMEFYQGALLALHNAQNDSTLYRVRVYDIERSERRVVALCNSNELDHIHGILGLAYPIQIEQMIPWSNTHQVPLVLPFSDDFDVKGYPYLYQFNSPDSHKAQAIADWISNKADSVHCVLLEDRETELAKSIQELQKQIKAHHIPYSKTSIQSILSDSLFLSLDSTKQNILVLHTDKYNKAHILISYIEKCKEQGYDIILFGQYSWQREDLGLPIIFTSVFEQNANKDSYEQLWKKYFNKEHVSTLPRYDLLGYDLMTELIRIVTKQEQTPNYLQSEIIWENSGPQDGWQNTNTRVMIKQAK